MDIDSLRRQIEDFTPGIEQEARDQALMLQCLRAFPDILTRKCAPAHFTASAWIVNPGRDRVLLIYHNIFQSWTWTGGHADGEADLLSVANREAQEETGLTTIRPITTKPISLETVCVDGHEKRGAYVSSHLHLNLTFLFEADEAEPLRVKPDENSGVMWAALTAVPALSREPWMTNQIYTKLNDRMRLWK